MTRHCSICGESGHYKKTCPMKDVYRDDNSDTESGESGDKDKLAMFQQQLEYFGAETLQRKCGLCGEEGHDKRVCPDSKDAKRGMCGICGQTGHNRRTCPNEKYDVKRCSVCGNSGHNKRTCPDAVDGGVGTKRVRFELYGGEGTSDLQIADIVKEENTKFAQDCERLTQENAKITEENAKIVQENIRITEEYDICNNDNTRLAERNMELVENVEQLQNDNAALLLQVQEIQQFQQDMINMNNRLRQSDTIIADSRHQIDLMRELQNEKDGEIAQLKTQLAEIDTAGDNNPTLLTISKKATCSVCGPLAGGDIPRVNEQPPQHNDIEMVTLTCEGGHGICNTCVTHMVKAATNNQDVEVTCCVGECNSMYDEENLQKYCDTKVYQDYIIAKAVYDNDQRMAKLKDVEGVNAGAGTSSTEIKNLAIIKAPCCGADVIDFNGCCNVGCVCGKRWCAWCFMVKPDEMETQMWYNHIHDCHLNPDKGRIYPTETGKDMMTRFWQARQAQQLAGKLGIDLATPRDGKG